MRVNAVIDTSRHLNRICYLIDNYLFITSLYLETCMPELFYTRYITRCKILEHSRSREIRLDGRIVRICKLRDVFGSCIGTNKDNSSNRALWRTSISDTDGPGMI